MRTGGLCVLTKHGSPPPQSEQSSAGLLVSDMCSSGPEANQMDIAPSCYVCNSRKARQLASPEALETQQTKDKLRIAERIRSAEDLRPQGSPYVPVHLRDLDILR